MDCVISAVLIGPERQHRVFDSIVRALRWIFLSLPGETKDSVSIKKLLGGGEGDCICAKEFLGWTIDTEEGTVALLERNIWELLTLLAIP